MKPTLEDIEKFCIELSEELISDFFTDENNNKPTTEHKEQIIALNEIASKFLWDIEHKIGITCSRKFYKNISTFISDKTKPKEIKKFLYNLGIPFSQKVFISVQPNCGFSMTWKMVIKYSDSLFNDYQQVWDKTLNWKLECNDYGEFKFGKGLVYNSIDEATKIEIAIKEMTLRNTK